MNDFADLERQLYGLEQQFLGPAARSSRKNLEELLAEDFVEFGSSGVVYDRASVISELVLEDPVAWSIASFKARPLAEGAALVTYVATKSGGESSSLLHLATEWRAVENGVSSGHKVRRMKVRSNSALERTARHGGPRLAAAPASWPAALLDR